LLHALSVSRALSVPRALSVLLAFAATLAFVAIEADAAPRFNAGSRGTRTYSAPPPTATSPGATRPIERSMTTPNRPAQPGAATAARPTTPATQPGGFFSRGGLLGGLAAGFLGAGLIGLLMGNGFLGGMAGFASFLGLLLQIGLVVLVAVLAWRWWQRRSQPATAPASGPAYRVATPDSTTGRTPFGGVSGFNARVDGGPIEIAPADYDTFERLLGEVYAAYSAEDLAAMRRIMTPEMVSYYAEELAKNASRGVVNQVTDVKLLQGDLAEAWHEDQDEYATVAMRYAINDRVIDRGTGRLIEGGPQEGIEMWTFRRARGGNWMLSAIQQTD
jgi:predicted lipid-binding transport protein (Tim44 family)